MKKIKGILAISIALMLTMSCFIFSSAADFNAKDVPEGYWGREAIKTLADNGIMQGSNGYFRPEDKITRVEYFALINRAFGLTSTEGAATFSDIDYTQNTWKTLAIQCASADGYLKGSGGKANPDVNITREEAFVLLARAKGIEAADTAAGFNDDSQISDWAMGLISAMKKAEMVSGSNGYLKPKDNLKRAEAAQVLLNVTGGVFVTPTPTETNDPNATVTPINGIKIAPYVPSKKYTVKPGLYVENKKLMHEGKEFRAVGVNFFSGFTNAFLSPKDSQYEEIFSLMNQYGIKYCRMNFSMFWPVNYKSMAANEERYFEVMDAVVKSAEQHNIGLICTMFWNPTGLSDYCDEPANRWGDPESKTRQFAAKYTKALVTRYAESPAIWGWEFSNEINLACDLPNRAELRNNSIVPSMGTRLTRTAEDDYITDFVTPAMTDWAKMVRQYDPYDRLLTSGNAEPRPSQWNQYMNNNWGRDYEEQMAETLLWHNPLPIDSVEVHTYDLARRFAGTETYEGVIKAFQDAANKQGRILFVGEFAQTKEKFKTVCDAIVANKVPIACVWAIGDVEYSLDNDKAWRAEVLSYIQSVNNANAIGE